MQDAENMTLGMWVDYVIEVHNMEYRSRKREEGGSHSRKATQADFDRF